MNKRTQLLEVIAALPEELVDQALNYVQMLQNPIQITPGVCGKRELEIHEFPYGLW